MGWFSSLGTNIKATAASIGQKVRGVAKVGRKFVHDHAAQIERVSKTIGDVAGVVGNVASAALPFVAAVPGVGEVVGGLAVGGKAVEAGARWVQKGAGTARKAEAALTSGEEAYRHGRSAIDRARHGQLVSAYKEGKQAYAGAKKTRKEIEAIRK